MLRSPVDSLCCALFPVSCRLCGDPLLRLTRVPVCDFCWNQLPEQQGILCAVCGEALGIHGFGDEMPQRLKPLASLESNGRAEAMPYQSREAHSTAEAAPYRNPSDGCWCRACRVAEPPFAQAVAYGVYQNELRALLHLLKYEGMDPVADKLGRLLAGQVLAMSDLPKQMVVAPVPLFKGKRKQRGFNQSDLLAYATVKAMRLSQPDRELSVATGLLERCRATESQAGLTPHQRRANMRGAFFAPSPEKLKGMDVLLIDDIYTTGATARACAQALVRGGAKSVRVATVARAQRQDMIQPQAAPAAEAPMHEDVAFWSAGFVPAVRSV